jgi:hypothetical protein
MVSLPFLVRCVDDEADSVAIGSPAGRSPTSRLVASEVGFASGLAGHRFAVGHFIDVNGTVESMKLRFEYRLV